MNVPIVRIGTRGSRLARIQAGLLTDALESRGHACELVVIETDGDRRAADTAWGEGAFVAAIEAALLAHRCDVAVHSAKDVPTRMDDALTIAAFLPRADARDALVIRTDVKAADLASLPAGSRIGTDSPRRSGFLLAYRPDLEVVPIHGNVDTRLRRLDAGEAEGLVLAAAGLERLGLTHRIAERLEPSTLPPAPGQGAIAAQVRRADALEEVVAQVDDGPTRAAVELERGFLRAMGGGCRSPIGAFASKDASGRTSMVAGVAATDGTSRHIETAVSTMDDPAGLAQAVAARLRSPTAEPQVPRARPARPWVLVTRPADQAPELRAVLDGRDLDMIHVPAIAIEPAPPGGELEAALLDLLGWDRIVITSRNGAEAALSAMARAGLDPRAWSWAAVGPVTAGVVTAAGATEVWMPSRAHAGALGAELPEPSGRRILLAHGDLADPQLVQMLRSRGADVHAIAAYRTRIAPAASLDLLADAMGRGRPAALVLASGSAARGLVSLAGDHLDALRHTPAICIGPRTAEEATAAGFRNVVVAARPSASAVAALVTETIATGTWEVRP